MTSVSTSSSNNAVQAALKASMARAADGDYKTAGMGHNVKDSDGDYKATATTPAAAAGAASSTSSATLAAVLSLSKGG